jgi:hypothetical protein
MSGSAAKPKAAQPTGRKTRSIVAALAMLAAWAVVLLTLYPLPPPFDRKPHTALGRVLAQEALKLQQPGGRIILISRDTTMFKSPAFEAQTEGFRQALRKARVEIAVTRLFKVDPLRVLGVPPGDFLELLRKADEKDVIVSLLGPPVLDAGQLAKLDVNRPQVLAVCSGAMPRQVDLKRLFDEKLIHAAVISREDPVTSSTSGATSAFDRLFKLITPANLAELPPLLSDAR